MYGIWRGIIKRCYHVNRRYYNDYGGRGIKVCDRWKNDFWKFVEDMSPRPENYYLDRIDVNSNYSPENCRWVTQSQNSMNRRKFKTNKSGFKGVHLMKSGKWCASISFNKIRIYVGKFKTKIEAAIAYDNKAKELHGEFASLNFPIVDKKVSL